MTAQEILDDRYWYILDERGSDFFKYFTKFNGSKSFEDLESTEYIEFEDWEEVLETYNPDLYNALDEYGGWGAFDIPHFYNCQGFHEINGKIVLESV